jgi:hypothetical protein
MFGKVKEKPMNTANSKQANSIKLIMLIVLRFFDMLIVPIEKRIAPQVRV